MTNTEIREDQWQKMYSFLQSHPMAYAGKEAECQVFVDAVHWILRSGAQWCLLPEKYGNWNSVYKRFACWCDHQVFEDLHQHFSGGPDMENIFLDSTVVRAHLPQSSISFNNIAEVPFGFGRNIHQMLNFFFGAVQNQFSLS